MVGIATGQGVVPGQKVPEAEVEVIQDQGRDHQRHKFTLKVQMTVVSCILYHKSYVHYIFKNTMPHHVCVFIYLLYQVGVKKPL